MAETDPSPPDTPIEPRTEPADTLLRQILAGTPARLAADLAAQAETRADLLRFLFPYRSLPELLALMTPEDRAGCERSLEENGDAFLTAPGSSANHQAWKGGYRDHLLEVLNLAVADYALLSALRPPPFTLSSALKVLFHHDDEKMVRYAWDDALGRPTVRAGLSSKAAREEFREERLFRYGVALTSEEANALAYVEGEGDVYDAGRRTMGELAAFCHRQDTWSARGWHDHPKTDDPWHGASRADDP